MVVALAEGGLVIFEDSGVDGLPRVARLQIRDVAARASVGLVLLRAIHDDLDNVAVLTKELLCAQDAFLGHRRGDANHIHEVALDHAHVVEMLPRGDLLCLRRAHLPIALHLAFLTLAHDL